MAAFWDRQEGGGVEDEPRTQVSEIRTQGKVMFLFQASGM